MKKIYFRNLLAVVLAGAMLSTVGCKDYDDDIDSINKKIDDIEKVKLPGIEEQIDKVKMSIPDISGLNESINNMRKDLDATNTKLGNLEGTVDNLTGQVKGFTEQFKQINEELSKLKTNLKEVETAANQYATDKTDGKLATPADITKLRGDLEDQISTLKKTLVTSEALEKALADYLRTDGVKDDATIKALTDAQTTLSGTIETLKGKLDDLTDPAKLAWQGKTFDDYVKSLGYVKTTYTDNDAQQAVIDAIEKDNEKYNAEYVAALVDLVKNAEVGMDGETAIKVSDLVTRQNEYKKSLDALTARVSALEVRIDELIARIQSLQYIPDYNDGKATVAYSKIIDQVIYSDVVMTYEVRPAEVAAKLAGVFGNNPEYFSYKLEKVATRAEAAPSLVIKKIEAVEGAEGRFVVTASAEHFAEGFTSDDPKTVVSYSAALSIEVPASSKGEDQVEHADAISRTTAYTNLAAKADMELVYALKNTTEGSTEIVKDNETAKQVASIEFDNTTGVKPMASYLPVYCDKANKNKLYTPEELTAKGYTVPAFTTFEVTFAIKDGSSSPVDATKTPFAVTEGENYSDYVVAMKAAQTATVKGYTSTGTWIFYFGDKKDGNKLTVSNVITVGGTVIERNLTDETAVWNYSKVADYTNGIVIESPVVLAQDEKFSSTHATLAVMLNDLTGKAQGGNDVTPTYTVTELGQTETPVSDAVSELKAKSGADNTAAITLASAKIAWGKKYRIEAKYEFEDITYNLTLATVTLDGLSQKEFSYTIPTETLTIDKGTGNVSKKYTVDALYTANSTVIDKYFGEDDKGKNAQLNFSKFLNDISNPNATAEAKTKDEEPKDITFDANTKLTGTFVTTAPTKETDPYMQIEAVVAADDVAKVGTDNAITYKNVYTKDLNDQTVKVTVNFTAKLALPEITVTLDPVSVTGTEATFKDSFDASSKAYTLTSTGFKSFFIVKVADKTILSSDFTTQGIEPVYTAGDKELSAAGLSFSSEDLVYKGKAESVNVTAAVKYHGIVAANKATITMKQPKKIFMDVKGLEKALKYSPADGTKTINLDKTMLTVLANTSEKGEELIIETGDGTNIFATNADGKTAADIYGAVVEIDTENVKLTLDDGTASPSLKAEVSDYAVTITYPTTASNALKLTVPVIVKSDYMSNQQATITVKLTAE